MKEIKRDSSNRIKLARKYKNSRIPDINPIELLSDKVYNIHAIKTEEYVEMAFKINEPLDIVFNTLYELEQSSKNIIEEYHRIIL